MTFSKQRLFEILEVSESGDRLGRNFDLFMMALILINVLAIIFETVESLNVSFGPVFNAIEYFSIIVFTIEYIARLWSCTADENYARPVIGRLKFAKQPLLIIDLLAFLPFYLSLAAVDVRMIRILRIFRIIRLAKLGRYSNAVRTLGHVINQRKEELLVTVLVMLVLLIISSTLVYYAERGLQPEVFSSIPAAMWWGVATFTTVGYGDVYPITVLGKCFAAVVSIIGIGMFALPAGIIGSTYLEHFRQEALEESEGSCPHCGK